MPRVRLNIELLIPERGRASAERVVDLPAVPGQGEAIWAAHLLALKVKGVAWLWQDDPTPRLWLGRSDGTPGSIVEGDGELTMPQTYVDDLIASGWTITEE